MESTDDSAVDEPEDAAEDVLAELHEVDLANLTPAQLLAQVEDWQGRLED